MSELELGLERAAYLVPYLVAVATNLWALAHCWRRRDRHPAARWLALALASRAAWTLGYLGELAAGSVAGKLVWDTLEFWAALGDFASVLPFGLLVAQRVSPARAWRAAALSVAWPAVAALFVSLEPWHHLARARAHISPGRPFDALVYPYLPLEYWGYVQATALGLLVALGLLLHARRQQPPYRQQTGLLALGTALPHLIGAASLLGVTLFGQRDLSPYGFAASGALLTWALFRRSLFEVAPVARELLLERVRDGVLAFDGEGRLADLNPAAGALLGLGRERIGQAREACLAGQPALLALLASDRLPDEATLELPGPRVVRAWASPIHPGAAAGTAVVLYDVTAEHRERAELTRSLDAAQQAFDASAAMLRELFDASSALLGLLTPEGTVLSVNRAALALSGAHLRDVVGRPFWETPGWAHDPALQARLRGAVAEAASGRPSRFEAAHQGGAGALRQVELSLVPVLGPGGAVSRLVAEAHDITERYEAERARAGLQEQLRQAQKLESIGRLAGGVAHDFNNLLLVIQVNASHLLGQAGLAPAQAESLREIERASESAAALTRALLAFGRRSVFEPRVLDARELVERTRRMLERLLGERVQLQLELAPGEARVRADPAHLEQVLVNLVVNARDAMPEGGRITLATRRREFGAAALAAHGAEGAAPGAYLGLAVSDTGTGMSPEVRARLFEPFFTTKPAGRGTGLGLATAWGIVRQLGGFIEVASELGRGSELTVWLPAEAAPAEAAPPPATALPRGSERVLLVEDQAPVRGVVERMLRLLGYQVRAFASGEEALAALGAEPFDLLLTDVGLPGMSGRELADRAQAASGNLRVLFASGHVDDVVLRHGIERGERHLLAKPFALDALARAVRTALDQPVRSTG